VLKLSSNVSDVFPKVLKLSSEVIECKPLPTTTVPAPGSLELEVERTMVTAPSPGTTPLMTASGVTFELQDAGGGERRSVSRAWRTVLA